MTFTDLSQHLGFGAPWEFTAAIFATVVGIPSGLALRHCQRRRR